MAQLSGGVVLIAVLIALSGQSDGAEHSTGRAIFPHEFRHHVIIELLTVTSGEEKWTLHCGGSIIQFRYILTAGSCLFKNQKLRSLDELRFTVGIRDLGANYLTEYIRTAYQFYAQKFFVKKFLPDRPNYQNIAMVKLTVSLERLMKNTKMVKMVSIGVNEADRNQTFFTTGGLWEARFLKRIIVPSLHEDKCIAEFGTEISKGNSYHRLLHICAGDWREAPCSKDVGGGLVEIADTQYTLYGVINDSPCGNPHTVSRYTRIEYWAMWIKYTIAMEAQRKNKDPWTEPAIEYKSNLEGRIESVENELKKGAEGLH